MPAIKVPKHLAEIWSNKEWKALAPEFRDVLASSSWQNASNYVSNSTIADVLVDYFPVSEKDLAKPSDLNWRELQKHTYIKYRTFGPLNSAVDSKANLIAERAAIYSDTLEINEFLKDLFTSYRNKLYAKMVGWEIRMDAEGEIFVLISLDDTGTATIRNLEPDRIGEGRDDKGLIVDPDDATQTIFYKHKNTGGFELIPDARFILEPDYMNERLKVLQASTNPADTKLISELTLGKGKFKSIGGFRRFVLHRKNLTGIQEYLRDTSSLSTTLEWVNLLIMHLKWQSDYMRALCAYTIEISFDNETPAGRQAWLIWNKMTDDQKAKTNLTKPMSPGQRVFTMPGMTIEIHAPQLGAMGGINQELFNLAGAGARTPQDLFQGQSSGATYASLKTSRPPLVAEIECRQAKLENFLRYELLRCCFKAKIALGGNFVALDGKTKYKLLDAYQVPWVNAVKKGKASIKKLSVEPVELVRFSWPQVNLAIDTKMGTLFYGSKNSGLVGNGLSREEALRRLGVDDFTRQMRRKLLEDEEYGEFQTGADQEQAIEQTAKNTGVDGSQTPELPPGKATPPPKKAAKKNTQASLLDQ